jgi:SAM-dependent methyltransferase
MNSNEETRVWAAGDLRPHGAPQVPGQHRLIDSVDVRAGERVLDVGTGTGNTALVAARRGAVVTGIDLVADFLATAQERATSERVEITTLVADAQDLPFPDGDFDVVLSTFAVMFARDAEQAAAELVRVCRPGGRIGLTAWTPDGFVGHSMAALARHQSTPGGMRPLRWGEPDFVRGLFTDGIADLQVRAYEVEMRHESADAGVASQRQSLGPVRATFDALDAAGQESLSNELKQAMARFNTATDGTVVVPAEYLEVVAVKAG